ncbi:MAG: thioredoxin family protein [Pseudomonadota bacterium]
MLLNTPTVEPGKDAIEFMLFDPDGNAFRLADVKGENGTLVAFICNHCPYVKAIADRLAEDARMLQADGIGVVAINANDYVRYPADSPARMREFAAQHQFPFPYLIDEDQSVAHAYGAVCTPDFFGLNAAGQLQYRGRLDSAGMGPAEDRTPELIEAMRQVATTGSGPEAQHASIGCSIKWRD